MTNLLDDTRDVFARNGVAETDVQWVGNDAYWFTWDEFVGLAKDTTFDGGFGGQMIVSDLTICGPDWYMTRGEYDGSEWWGFHQQPDKPDRHYVPSALRAMYPDGTPAFWKKLEPPQ